MHPLLKGSIVGGAAGASLFAIAVIFDFAGLTSSLAAARDPVIMGSVAAIKIGTISMITGLLWAIRFSPASLAQNARSGTVVRYTGVQRPIVEHQVQRPSIAA